MATKQKIIDSAILVLNADFSAPIDKIAEQAGLSRRTLHRHFPDRSTLIIACWHDMMQGWQTAMLALDKSHHDPVKQLEGMLYAGIDCGVKYAFLNKLQTQLAAMDLPETAEYKRYQTVRDNWLALIPELQRKNIIQENLSAAWIRILFTHIITATIEALHSGDIAPNDIKPLAWYSFRRSLGID